MSIGKRARGVRNLDITSRIKGGDRVAARPESFPSDSGPGRTPGSRPGAERMGCRGRVKSEIRSQPSAGSVVAVDDETWRDGEGIELRTARQVGERGHREAGELVRSLPRIVHRPVALEEVAQLLG